MAASGDNFIFEIFLSGCFSKDSCKGTLTLEIQVTHVLHFPTPRHVKEKRIFMNNFLSEGFSEKCKHTELALNFIQKQCFS